ncbi:MAG TPA: PTS sugar transporter subunit IIB [Anaerolineaceae bacterium]|nr:PTS sugar transporter subunit IIB [Anaerolineaceae bacterium]
MKKIILLCALGMSTSITVAKIRRAFAEEELDIELSAYSENQLVDYIDDADLVLLAPQIAYLEDELMEECAKHHKKCVVFPIDIYATSDKNILISFIKPLIEEVQKGQNSK